MSRSATWTNSDGLVVGFGTHSADNGVAAVDGGSGIKKTMTMMVDLVDVSTAATDANTPPQSTQIKRGSIITNAYIETVIAATGASSTLDIGLWGRGTLATPVTDDANGIASGITIGEMTTVGEILDLKTAKTGAYLSVQDAAGTPVIGKTVGATSLSDCVPSVEWNTAAFTAGRVIITIEYIEPQGSAVASV
jgi:hypothetical protein